VRPRTALTTERFPDQHYSVLFNRRTGFFARIEEPGHEPPFWSQHGPELLDISITGWCDRGCATCYRESGPSGKHMPLEDYGTILRQARSMHVLQVALGGGNPNQHPDFCEMLRMARQDYGIVPNYTTNGRGLTPEVVRASGLHCGAVAVSAYETYEEMTSAITALLRGGIQVNVHFVLDSASIETAVEWLEHQPHYLGGINAIVFLNHKPVGRHPGSYRPLRDSPLVEQFFRLATAGHRFQVGFDSCLATGLARFTDVSPVCFDGCEAGRFSMFVSEDMRMYPCSFMATDGAGLLVESANMLEVWRNSEPFVAIRAKLATDRCPDCNRSSVCMGGCPVFPEIGLCGNR